MDKFTRANDWLLKGWQQRARDASLSPPFQSASPDTSTNTSPETSKVQSSDSENPLAHVVAAQMQRDVLTSLLRNARALWAEQKVDECAELLATVAVEFSNDAEFLRLTSIVRQELSRRRTRANDSARFAAPSPRKDLDAAETVADELRKGQASLEEAVPVLPTAPPAAVSDVLVVPPVPLTETRVTNEASEPEMIAPEMPAPGIVESKVPTEVAKVDAVKIGAAKVEVTVLGGAKIPATEKSAPPAKIISPNKKTTRKTTRNLPFVPLAVAAAVIAAMVLVGLHFFKGGATAQEIALLRQAEHKEKMKDWPGALTDYFAVARMSGALTQGAVDSAQRLQQLIAKESDLFQQAQSRAAIGDFATAKALYLQAANLHGDRQSEAISAAASLNLRTASESTLTQSDPTPVPVARQSSSAMPPVPAATQTASAQTQNLSPVGTLDPPKAAISSELAPCPLSGVDASSYLDTADRNFERGNFAVAERQYNAILQCAPNNDRARVGLSLAASPSSFPMSRRQ